MTKRPRVAIETLGCKLNLADSEQLARDFARAGFEVVPAEAAASLDVFVLNTCTVTHVADRKARQQLRGARRRFPSVYLVATGCYPARAAAEVEALPEVDLVAGNAAKRDLVSRIASALRERDSGVAAAMFPVARDTPPRAVLPAGATRAFVKIQEGCNDYCSYCIIPKTRGASRTVPAETVIEAILEREAAGYQEVVLTGTQLGDYGIPLAGSRRQGPDRRDQGSEGDPLATLLRDVLAQTRVPRIRLSSLQPQDVSEALLALWKRQPRLAPHFHLPLQSGSASLLRSMRRRYTPEEYAASLGLIRERVPGVSITTDVIVGFPGETDGDFDATTDLCSRAGFADIHVFPYSSRPGTLATRFEGAVSDPIKQRRSARLLALAEESRQAHQARFAGSIRPVLWEEKRRFDFFSEPLWHGLTDNYLRVFSGDDRLQAGCITPTRLTRVNKRGLWGEPVAPPRRSPLPHHLQGD